MPALTGFQIKRWSYHTSAREPGFTVDRAEIEYEEVSQSTLLAQEPIFDQATRQDSVDIFVTVGSVETLLFAGIIREWEITGEGPDGKLGSRLVVEDERGKMLDFAIPVGTYCPGVTIDAGSGQLTAGESMLSLIKKLASLVGITIDTTGAPDYTVGPDFAPAPGTTVGQAIARLLQGYQQVRRERLDLIRTGPNTYKLKKRPATLTGGIDIPRSAVRLRSYRKTYVPPVTKAEVKGFLGTTSEAASTFDAQPAMQCVSGVLYELSMPTSIQITTPITETKNFSNFDSQGRITSDGFVRTTRLGDKPLEVYSFATIWTYRPDGAVEQTILEKRQVYTYDGQGRLVKVKSERYLDTALEAITTKTINRDSNGRIIQEGLTLETSETVDPFTGSTLASPEIFVTRAETIRKIPVGKDTYKEVERLVFQEGEWTAEPDVSELSGGDTLGADDPVPKWPMLTTVPQNFVWEKGMWLYQDHLIADATAARSIEQSAKDQGGQWLVEVEIEMPLDPSVTMHKVVHFTGSSLIGIDRFLVTELHVEDSREMVMRVHGEAWVSGAGGDAAGTTDVRGGFPLGLIGPRMPEARRILSGVVTGVNANGTAVVFLPEEGIVYPSIRGAPGLPPVAARDRILVERVGMVLSRVA